MAKGRLQSLAVSLIIIPLGGLLMMALTLEVYGVTYNVLESLFFLTIRNRFPPVPYAWHLRC